MGVSLLPSLIAACGGRYAGELNGGRKGQEPVVICSASPSAKLLLLQERNENRQGPGPPPGGWGGGGPGWGVRGMRGWVRNREEVEEEEECE